MKRRVTTRRGRGGVPIPRARLMDHVVIGRSNFAFGRFFDDGWDALSDVKLLWDFCGDQHLAFGRESNAGFV